MSKCNACKGKGCDYCDEFYLGLCRQPRKPTRMRGTNVWLVEDGDGGWGGYLSKGDAELYARRYGGSVRRAYVKAGGK